MLTETDDFFCHQTIAPHAHVVLNDLSWGERAYHTLSDPDRFALDIGVATYPNRGMFHTYAIAGVPGKQWSLPSEGRQAVPRPCASSPLREHDEKGLVL
jgi:hypothetical protein